MEYFLSISFRWYLGFLQAFENFSNSHDTFPFLILIPMLNAYVSTVAMG
jgi:hypothetical protein